MSADGQYLAYATENRELEVLSTTTGERVQELRLRCVGRQVHSRKQKLLAKQHAVCTQTEPARCVTIRQKLGCGLTAWWFLSGWASLLPSAQPAHVLQCLMAAPCRAPFCDCVAWSPTANVLAYTDEILDPTETRQRVVIGSVVIFAPPKAQAAAAG
jgi:hypothetical protein